MYVPDARHEHLAIAPQVRLVTGKVYALTMRCEIAVRQHEVLHKALYIVVKRFAQVTHEAYVYIFIFSRLLVRSHTLLTRCCRRKYFA